MRLTVEEHQGPIQSYRCRYVLMEIGAAFAALVIAFIFSMQAEYKIGVAFVVIGILSALRALKHFFEREVPLGQGSRLLDVGLGTAQLLVGCLTLWMCLQLLM